MIKSLAVLVSLAFAATNAQAGPLLARVWISATGIDQAGCGPITNACRTLQYAHDQTAPGGEIDVKDSAGYGSVIISKAISIVGDGSLAGVLAASGGSAITINATAADVVILRGLTIEGSGSGANGIVFNSGGTLDISNCSVQNFAGNAPAGIGVLLQPTSGSPTIVIVNTVASHNFQSGIAYLPTSGNAAASLIFDRITTVGNNYGVTINGAGTSAATTANISNSLVGKNQSNGFFMTGSLINATLDLSSVVRNANDGILITSGALTIARSVVANNGGFGINTPASATVSSYGNNQISGNTSGNSQGTIGVAAFH